MAVALCRAHCQGVRDGRGKHLRTKGVTPTANGPRRSFKIATLTSPPFEQMLTECFCQAAANVASHATRWISQGPVLVTALMCRPYDVLAERDCECAGGTREIEENHRSWVIDASLEPANC